MITLIVARDRAGAIGRAGDIPWDAPADLAAFQRETHGGAVIMGRHTWESLPRRPLPRRMNIVVSRSAIPDASFSASVSEAIALARAAGHMRIYGIGGARIYAEMLPVADRLLITEVPVTVEDADTFFPFFDPEKWHESTRFSLQSPPEGLVQHEFLRRV